MTVADGDGIRFMQKKESRCLFYQIVKTKFCNCFPVDCYTKKLRQIFISVPKRCANTFTIFTENCRLVTVLKLLINISEGHENKSRLPFQFKLIIIPVHI